jgi:hypothetical protein
MPGAVNLELAALSLAAGWREVESGLTLPIASATRARWALADVFDGAARSEQLCSGFRHCGNGKC